MNDLHRIVVGLLVWLSFTLAADDRNPSKPEGPSDAKKGEIQRLREEARAFFNRADYSKALERMKQALKEV